VKFYSITKGQAAIGAFTRAMRDRTGNLPPMPGVFPDYPAPIVRNAPDGVRELMLARWACRDRRSLVVRRSQTSATRPVRTGVRGSMWDPLRRAVQLLLRVRRHQTT
jgi:hypothetical protein